jgi:hypothetical protein
MVDMVKAKWTSEIVCLSSVQEIEVQSVCIVSQFIQCGSPDDKPKPDEHHHCR